MDFFALSLASAVATLFLVFLIVLLLVLLSIHVWLRLTNGRCTSTRDLTGKVAIITGGNTGIGLEVVKDLARRNARIIMAQRSVTRGQQAAELVIAETGNQNIEVRECDLSRLRSVRAFCEDVLAKEAQLDLLICFAGGGAPWGRHLTEDGVELQFAQNHLGHFLMVTSLVDLLKKSAPARVVIVSSLAHKLGRFDLPNMIAFDQYVQHPFMQYADTKLANVIFAKELAERLAGSGVAVNALHPGTVYTNGIKFNSIFYLKAFLLLLCALYGKSTRDGAETIIHLAACEEVEGVSGQYYADCKQVACSRLVQNQQLRRQLWDESEKLCGMHAPRGTLALEDCKAKLLPSKY